MSKILFVALILISPIAFGKSKVVAKCFPNDTVKIWEERYCLFRSGAENTKSDEFTKCYQKLKKNASVPKKKCERIIWLKNKVCKEDPGSGHSIEECLIDKNYLRNFEPEPNVGP